MRFPIKSGGGGKAKGVCTSAPEGISRYLVGRNLTIASLVS
jgi:hypothetical protein